MSVRPHLQSKFFLFYPVSECGFSMFLSLFLFLFYIVNILTIDFDILVNGGGLPTIAKHISEPIVRLLFPKNLMGYK